MGDLSGEISGRGSNSREKGRNIFSILSHYIISFSLRGRCALFISCHIMLILILSLKEKTTYSLVGTFKIDKRLGFVSTRICWDMHRLSVQRVTSSIG